MQPEGLAHTHDVVYAVDDRRHVHAYNCPGGSPVPSAEFDLDAENAELDPTNARPTGITAVSGCIHVLDGESFRVFAYEDSHEPRHGERRPEREFRLRSGRGAPQGVTGGGTASFRVVEWYGSRVFSYD